MGIRPEAESARVKHNQHGGTHEHGATNRRTVKGGGPGRSKSSRTRGAVTQEGPGVGHEAVKVQLRRPAEKLTGADV